MTLRERARRGLSASSEPAAGLVCPFALCQRYLSDHPLVRSMGVSVADVHAAAVKLAEDVRRSTTSAPLPQRKAGGALSSACKECGHDTFEHDLRESWIVCQRCGAVANCRSMHWTHSDPEYVDETLCRRAMYGTHCSVQSRGESEITADAAKAWNDLSHWNWYTHHSEWHLKTTSMRLLDAVPKRTPWDVKICTVLLFPLLDDEMTRIDVQARRELRKRSSPRAMESSAPKPVHPCPQCGELFHCRKHAKYHCRLRCTKFPKP